MSATELLYAWKRPPNNSMQRTALMLNCKGIPAKSKISPGGSSRNPPEQRPNDPSNAHETSN